MVMRSPLMTAAAARGAIAETILSILFPIYLSQAAKKTFFLRLLKNSSSAATTTKQMSGF